MNKILGISAMAIRNFNHGFHILRPHTVQARAGHDITALLAAYLDEVPAPVFYLFKI
jgi:hypothetical protein